MHPGAFLFKTSMWPVRTMPNLQVHLVPQSVTIHLSPCSTLLQLDLGNIKHVLLMVVLEVLGSLTRAILWMEVTGVYVS